ncbi:MAG TPA: 5-(carboxyamino)imidazole ribonucleotide mutase [Ktedonobacterales bacterium]
MRDYGRTRDPAHCIAPDDWRALTEPLAAVAGCTDRLASFSLAGKVRLWSVSVAAMPLKRPGDDYNFPGQAFCVFEGEEIVQRVLILMGSDSDLTTMKGAADALTELAIPYEIHIASAHRTPEKAMRLASSAAAEGFGVIIAGAGGAAHLPGVLAAVTTLPVIGVPIASGALNGVDALYAIVQMPKGIPVATVAIDGAYNAGLLAARVLALGNPELSERLIAFRRKLAEQVEQKDQKLQEKGISGYLNQK